MVRPEEGRQMAEKRETVVRVQGARLLAAYGQLERGLRRFPWRRLGMHLYCSARSGGAL
jgi:hypothetical protein